ncbi:acyl-CoA dehydrogenase family protein [Nocardia vinacea]|uniref:acyl-CoA dehydrogenase family protein n=1 Tax=Nocardia vinacea TaxID=96468 RepID=UPI003429E5A4
MTVDPTYEQEPFHSTTRDFLRRTMLSDVPREISDTATGFDREWWRRRAELGWAAMLVPETLVAARFRVDH